MKRGKSVWQLQMLMGEGHPMQQKVVRVRLKP